jgi:hypothetical protein
MCAKNKVWKRYKNVSGGNFSEFWENLEDSEKDEWQNERKRRRTSNKDKRTSNEEENEVSSSED